MVRDHTGQAPLPIADLSVYTQFWRVRKFDNMNIVRFQWWLLPQNVPAARVHVNVSGNNQKNLKTIGSIIYVESQVEKGG